MITSASGIPWDGYWRTAGQVFSYPLATVFARTREEADAIAGPGIQVKTYDQLAFGHLMLDSAEAQSRLGLWGRPDLHDDMMRGDVDYQGERVSYSTAVQYAGDDHLAGRQHPAQFCPYGCGD
jgi:hypothetical protein